MRFAVLHVQACPSCLQAKYVVCSNYSMSWTIVLITQRVLNVMDQRSVIYGQTACGRSHRVGRGWDVHDLVDTHTRLRELRELAVGAA